MDFVHDGRNFQSKMADIENFKVYRNAFQVLTCVLIVQKLIHDIGEYLQIQMIAIKMVCSDFARER